MCSIYCNVCGQVITDNDQVIQVRQGFVERGDYTPELEVAYYHVNCYPVEQPAEDR